MSAISVIVPVFNVEKYLHKCVDSILNQTYQDFELILIDDGSTDNCPRICDEYTKRDDRVIVIHKKNGGLSSARNAGLDIAKGEYISFVDSDDWVSKKYLECMLQGMRRTKCDICRCDAALVYNDKIIKNKYELEIVTSNNIFDKNIFSEGRYYTTAWAALYKKEVIGTNRFVDGVIHEDEFFSSLLYSKPLMVCCLNESLYYYNNANSGSITKNKNAGSVLFSALAMLYRCFILNDKINAETIIYYYDCAFDYLRNYVRKSFDINSKSLLSYTLRVFLKYSTIKNVGSKRFFRAIMLSLLYKVKGCSLKSDYSLTIFSQYL